MGKRLIIKGADFSANRVDSESGGQAPVYVLTVNPGSLTVPSTGGEVNVTVTSTKDGAKLDYSMSALPDWLTFSDNAFTVSGNGSGSQRNAVVTITQSESGKKATLTVSQEAVQTGTKDVWYNAVDASGIYDFAQTSLNGYGLRAVSPNEALLGAKVNMVRIKFKAGGYSNTTIKLAVYKIWGGELGAAGNAEKIVDFNIEEADNSKGEKTILLGKTVTIDNDLTAISVGFAEKHGNELIPVGLVHGGVHLLFISSVDGTLKEMESNVAIEYGLRP